MKRIKNIVAFVLTLVMTACLFGHIDVSAKAVQALAVPKVTLKTISKDSGIKIIIAKTKDAEGYEVHITGKPSDSEYNQIFKYISPDGVFDQVDEFYEYIEKDGKAKRTLTHKDLQPGTYTVQVRSWNKKKYGTKTYSEWSTKQTFTLKETATKGYSDTYDFSKAKVGDIVTFGAFEQDLNYTNGKEPIEWIVLKKTKKQVMLLSKYALEKLPYTMPDEGIIWETSTIRRWLNNNFIKSAFNKTEQAMIKTTLVENYDNVESGVPAGDDTKDKVFLLSQLDSINTDFGFSEHYSAYDDKRLCAYCWNKGKRANGFHTEEGEDACTWILRSPAYMEGLVLHVTNTGFVCDIGWDVYSYLGIRPAICIDLKSK